MDEPTAQVQSERWNVFAIFSAIAGILAFLVIPVSDIVMTNYGVYLCDASYCVPNSGWWLTLVGLVWLAFLSATIVLFVLALRANWLMRRGTYLFTIIGGVLALGVPLMLFLLPASSGPL